MAWWNGAVLIAMVMIPSVAAGLGRRTLGVAGRGFMALDVLLLRLRIHPLVHAPAQGAGVESPGLFFRLNGHHLLHHRYMHKNFNVVLPLAEVLAWGRSCGGPKAALRKHAARPCPTCSR